MTTDPSLSTRYDHVMAGNYARPALTLVRGRGSRVWDDEGRSYLDFAAGIAVNAIGHSHPLWIKRVCDQAAEMVHCSNLYRHPGQVQLAEKIVQRAGPGRVLFVNSGTEANEALLKLARLHGAKLAGGEGRRYKVICAQNAFHGRTFGGMAATPQDKIQTGFRPMLEGFAFGRLNDLAHFASLCDDQTAAIFVETIQGESGIQSCTVEFLQGLRRLCDERHLLLMLDEVQCGSGRTGRYYAFEHAGIRPDAIGMAKGLGGGFPMGAIWIDGDHADLFTPGSHGSTFAGGPLACAAGLAVFEIIEQENLLDRIQQQAPAWHRDLEGLAVRYPAQIREIRGLGYMIGLALRMDPLPLVAQAREQGLLTVRAGDQTLRLLPPLNVSAEELRESVHILDRILGAASGSQAV